MYGFHCVRAALQNPIRHYERLVATRAAITGLGELPETSPNSGTNRVSSVSHVSSRGRNPPGISTPDQAPFDT